MPDTARRWASARGSRAIKDASKQTLRELRTTLGVLRQVDEAQPLSPAPSLGRIDDRQAKMLIGVIVLGLLALHFWRRRRAADEAPERAGWFAPAVGVLAGFTTLVANAAGPLMAIYLLAMRLPKMEFVGTGAVFFLLLNLFKVPFMVNLGLINGGSVTLNLVLAPAVLLGAWIGRKILGRIDQKLFETLALVLSAVAGLKLLW